MLANTNYKQNKTLLHGGEEKKINKNVLFYTHTFKYLKKKKILTSASSSLGVL